jgi:hypothetical protein
MKTNLAVAFTLVILLTFLYQPVWAQAERDLLEYQHQLEYDKIVLAQKAVDQYTAGKSIYLAGEYGGEWLLRAVSMQARDKWAEHYFVRDNARKIFDKMLNALAASAAKKFPIAKPKAEFFAFHSKAEEDAMKAALDNLGTLEIHKIGLLHDKWQQISNDGPFQEGYIWARDKSKDYSYCLLYRFKLTKRYIGGGNYSDECEASVMEDNVIMGCP